MAETSLVDSDVEAGRELLNLLDGSGFPVTAAAWIYFPDIEEWKLLIRTPRAAENLIEALHELASVMDQHGDLRQRLSLSRIKLVPPTDRMLQAIGKTMNVTGSDAIRVNKNVVDGMYIDDALIYRLAA
jgi:hypothetical protein